MTMEFSIRTELREERRARRYAWTSRQKECTTPRITVPDATRSRIRLSGASRGGPRMYVKRHLGF